MTQILEAISPLCLVKVGGDKAVVRNKLVGIRLRIGTSTVNMSINDGFTFTLYSVLIVYCMTLLRPMFNLKTYTIQYILQIPIAYPIPIYLQQLKVSDMKMLKN